MTIISKTAYPRFKKTVSPSELKTIYSPKSDELKFVLLSTKGKKNKLHLMLFLKSFQRLGHFTSLDKIPCSIVKHVAKAMSLSSKTSLQCAHSTKIRFYNLIREFCEVKPYGLQSKKMILDKISERAAVIDNPSDLINIAVEELANAKFELPAFSTLDRLVHHIRNKINSELYNKIYSGLTETQINVFLDQLVKKDDESFTKFQQLKQYPKNPTLRHLKDLLNHLTWLMSFGQLNLIFKDIAISKIECFASEAYILDAAEMKDMGSTKQTALIASLIYISSMKNRDYLAEMFIRRLSSIHKKGKAELESIRDKHRKTSEKLIDTCGTILKTMSSADMNVVQKWTNIKFTVDGKGGAESLINDYEEVSAYNNDNYYILLWRHFKSHRAALFLLIESLTIKSTTHDDLLIKAMHFMMKNKNKKTEFLEIQSKSLLGFASEKWKTIILEKQDNKLLVNRHNFEICLFSCLAEALHSIDIYIEDSLAFADYRKSLLPLNECDKQLDAHCKAIGIPNNAKDFVQFSKTRLMNQAQTTDDKYPRNVYLQIDKDGISILKKQDPKPTSQSALKLEKLILSRMPERNIIDIVVNSAYWTDFTSNFGPTSGSEPKLSNAFEKYVSTSFAYGCSLGPTQTAQHLKNEISAHTIQYINQKHITDEALDKAMESIIDTLKMFDLLKNWGDPNKAIADGTFVDIYQKNLIAESHVRYGGYGGIAYHHISDTYMALFSHFIPCGVWEAIYIIEGLLKQKSGCSIDTVHADTQGQSAVVFAVAFLLGIKLEPRIRNWKDLIFYRPSKNIYAHIDALFSSVPDWDLIEKHWKDIMQVILSIKAGKISSAVLLKRLGNYSKRNKLYQAFRELGRVIRTTYLLEYISDAKKRKQINASTNKIESYNAFSQWLSFGSLEIIRSNFFDEQEKAVKYNDVIANSVILQNVNDMSKIIKELKAAKIPVYKKDLATLSPYITEHIKRFGNYVIDASDKPPDLNNFLKL